MSKLSAGKFLPRCMNTGRGDLLADRNLNRTRPDSRWQMWVSNASRGVPQASQAASSGSCGSAKRSASGTTASNEKSQRSGSSSSGTKQHARNLASFGSGPVTTTSCPTQFGISPFAEFAAIGRRGGPTRPGREWRPSADRTSRSQGTGCVLHIRPCSLPPPYSLRSAHCPRSCPCDGRRRPCTRPMDWK